MKRGSKWLPERSRFPFLLLLLTCSAGLSFPDSPQPDPAGPAALKQMSLEELSQIDITSVSKEPKEAFQTPVAIYVITSDDIRRSGANSIPEALRLAPGVEVARIDANKWSVGIRGFGSRLSRSVLVLIDGRTVYTTLLAGTYWEVQDTVMDDIDRIEIIRGPGGTIWGPNAVNGVINIITKDTKDTHGALVTAGGGNVEQGFGSFRYGGGNGKDLNYRFYTKGFTRGPQHHADDKNFDDWRGAQAGFRMDWNKQNRDTFSLQGDVYRIEAGQRVTATSYTQPFQRDIDANAPLSGGNIMAKWRRLLSPGNDIQFQVYYDRTNRHEANFGELRDTFDFDFVQHVGFLGRQQLTWGTGARFSHGDDLQVVSGLTFLPSQRTDQLFTAFVQDEFPLIERRLALTFGTKMLRTNFTGFNFEPSARLSWTPGKNQTFWAAFTHAVRTPSDAEEDFFLSGLTPIPANLPVFARFNANNGFVPEQMNGVELGYRHLMGEKALLDVATFYNHYHDLFDEELTGGIVLESDPPPTHYLLPAQFGNGLLGTTKGFEIAPEVRPAGFWRLRSSYSFLMMQIHRAPGSRDIGTGPGITGASPRHQALVQSSFDVSKNFSLDLTYRYISALTAQSVPGYSTGDIRFGWRLNRNLELSLNGRNLLQPDHPEFSNDPGGLVGIRRSFFAKLTWGE